MIETVLEKGIEPLRWLVVAGIAYTLATSIWFFFEAPTIPISTTSTQSSSTTPKQTGNVNWILAKNLFGEAGAAPVVTDSNEPAVQTRLPLELQSVFVADEAEYSAAIVAQRGKPGLRYKINDTLPGNAKLVEVATDRIILRRAGVRETLMFPKFSTRYIAEATEDLDDPSESSTGLGSNASSNNNNSAQGGQATGQGQLAQYRDRLAADAQGTLEELGIESVSDGGYRIGNVAQSPYLRQSGLQSGDIILSVNGRPVGNIQQDQLELDNIIAQGSARVEIQRGSRRFFITASVK
ncbi:MAG: hypothetical protein GXP16_02945 [Gammaproteobacteria bacterium]|nr:hypothetical protein [Gammaproteobacteria bacterium]